MMLVRGNLAWHGVKLREPDWSDWSHSVALSAELPNDRLQLYLILNAHREPLDFELPTPAPSRAWRRWIDTALDSPQDINDWESAPTISCSTYRLQSHSVVVLIAETSEVKGLATP
jgi:glycogen operon protein